MNTCFKLLYSVIATLLLAVGSQNADAFDLVYTSGTATSDGGMTWGAVGPHMGFPSGTSKNITFAFVDVAPQYYFGVHSLITGWLPGSVTVTNPDGSADLNLNFTPFLVSYTSPQFNKYAVTVLWVGTYNGVPVQGNFTIISGDWHGTSNPYINIDIFESDQSPNNTKVLYAFSGTTSGTVAVVFNP